MSRMSVRNFSIPEKNENGFSTAWLIGFALLIFIIGAVYFQVGTVLVQRQDLVKAADRAANAGATALDEEELVASDGTNVRLDNSSDPDLNAIDRCQNVLIDEQANGSPLELSKSGCVFEAGSGNQVIIATAKGQISFGALFSWLGVPDRDFEVTSKARPTCSDSTNATTGDC